LPQEIQPVRHDNRKAGCRCQLAGYNSANPEIKSRNTGMMIAKNNAGRRQMKGADTVKGDEGN
jgi:hypothetical protein